MSEGLLESHPLNLPVKTEQLSGAEWIAIEAIDVRKLVFLGECYQFCRGFGDPLAEICSAMLVASSGVGNAEF